MKFILVISAILLFVRCNIDSQGTACTEEARSSVTLKIVDAATESVVEEATVVFTVDGGAETTLDCTSDSTAVESDCASLTLAYEIDGEFEITVSSPGFADQTKTVIVEKDECHVLGKTLTFEMVAE